MAKVWETWWMFVICLYAMHVYIHLIFTLLSVHQSNRHKVCFENGWCFQSKRRKKWHFCLQRGNSIRKSWKLNSSYRGGWRAISAISVSLHLIEDGYEMWCIWCFNATFIKKIPCIRSGKRILSMIGIFWPPSKETPLFSSKHSLIGSISLLGTVFVFRPIFT